MSAGPSMDRWFERAADAAAFAQDRAWLHHEDIANEREKGRDPILVAFDQRWVADLYAAARDLYGAAFPMSNLVRETEP